MEPIGSSEKKTSHEFEPFVDISVVMNLLGVKRKTIYNWCYRDGKPGFPRYKIGRYLKFRLSEINGWLLTCFWSNRISKSNTK